MIELLPSTYLDELFLGALRVGQILGLLNNRSKGLHTRYPTNPSPNCFGTMSTKPPRKNSSARSSTARLPPTTEMKNDENEQPKSIGARPQTVDDKAVAHTASETPSPAPDEPDAFENADDSDDDNVEITRASVDLDELPIELVQLIDKYVT